MRKLLIPILITLAGFFPASALATTFATVQHKSAAGSSASPTLTLTTAPVQGNLVVLGVSANQSSAITCPTGYTALTSVAAGSPARTQRLCYKVAGASESTMLTASITTSQPWVAEAAEYSTAGSTVNAPNESAQANAASTSMMTPTVTPTSGLAGLVVGMTGQNSGGVWSAGEINASTTGVTIEVTKAQNAAVSAALFDKVITSTSGTYNAQATSSVSAAGAGSIVVFTVGTALPPHPGGGSWSLAYDEEFSGTSIPSGWANPGFFGNNLTPTGSLATVSGGDLHILRNSTQTGSIQNCTNAGNSNQAPVNSNSWLLPVNGYVEASIYLPASGSALYNWNAGLWMTTSDGAELDVEENLAGVATPTYHWPVGNQTRGPTIGTFATVGNGFHTFGALRLASSAQVYVDGTLVWTVTTHDAGNLMCLNINSGSGQGNTDATTSPNNEMKEDWIHGWI